jgi:hypothetical protein
MRVKREQPPWTDLLQGISNQNSMRADLVWVKEGIHFALAKTAPPTNKYDDKKHQRAY